jgi:hypothetical protein
MPLSGLERILRIRVKTDRAQHHFNDLKPRAEEFRSKYTTVVGTNLDKQTGEESRYFATLQTASFEILSIAGDILQNLRSALDHIIYQLAEVAHPDVDFSETTRLGFPIGRDFPDYIAKRCRQVEGLIHPIAISHIDSLKPYKGGEDWFWFLHEANNVDKHRFLISVGKDCLFSGPNHPGLYWFKECDKFFNGLFEPESNQNMELRINKPVVNSGIFGGEALIPSLEKTITSVQIVVETFMPFLEPH